MMATPPDRHSYLMLLHPSANRVYAGSVEQLAAAELGCLVPGSDSARPVELSGVRYLEFASATLAGIGSHSAALALFDRSGDLLRPVPLSRPDVFDDDLVSIPKYQGKTNEQFTRLMVNVTLAQVRPDPRHPQAGPLTVLDPLCGRGTTLSTAWTLGHHAAGVDSDAKAVEAYAAFLRTYLRRKRLKHTVTSTPVRREGKSLGRRLDAQVTPGGDRCEHVEATGPDLTLGIYTGDTRMSAALWGKRRFDAVVTDAPYGVVHGSGRTDAGRDRDRSAASDPGKRDRSAASGPGKRDRSAARLLAEAVPVWAGQLRAGGALGIAWNTLGLRRDALSAVVSAAGLEVKDTGPFSQFAHRVDASIHRDLLVAVKP